MSIETETTWRYKGSLSKGEKSEDFDGDVVWYEILNSILLASLLTVFIYKSWCSTLF